MISDDPRTWLGDKPPYTAEAKIAAEVNVKRVNGASNAKANGHAEPFSLISEGNVADVFAAQHANALRYCHDTGAWYAWDGTRWKRERTKLAYRWAHQLAKRLAIETKNAKTAITAGKAAFAAGVERIAQSDRAFAVTNDLWDQDPWLLATPGGTVDLRTGELRDPRQTDFITRRVCRAGHERGLPGVA